MKIPFDIKFRSQIESGEYKVETKGGNKVRILKFDIKDEDYPIAGIVSLSPECERVTTWRIDGGFHISGSSERDLVLITPEPELTESEDERMIKVIKHILYENYTDAAVVEGVEIAEIVTWLEKQKEPHYTKRNELFDKCVENCDPEIMKEVSDVIDKELQKEQKPEEWSEEDEKRRKNVLRLITEANNRYIKEESRSPFCAEILWLESLRPLYHGDITMTEAYKMGLEAGKVSSWKPDYGDLVKEINAIRERYPEISFAKLSRICVRIANWQKKQIIKDERNKSNIQH